VGEFFLFYFVLIFSLGNGIDVTQYFALNSTIGGGMNEYIDRNLTESINALMEMKETWEVLFFIGSSPEVQNRFIELLKENNINPKSIVILPLWETLHDDFPNHDLDFILSNMSSFS